MNRTHDYLQRAGACRLKRRDFTILAVVLLASVWQVRAQQRRPSQDSAIPAKHLIGFAGARNGANGALYIEADVVQFEQSGAVAPVAVNIPSIRDVVLGQQSGQVGGVPLTLAKAAVPFSGGRAVSLVSHKTYDTLLVQYVDTSGGLHGAVFQLKRGQGEVFRNELVRKGARVHNDEHAPSKPTAEAHHD